MIISECTGAHHRRFDARPVGAWPAGARYGHVVPRLIDPAGSDAASGYPLDIFAVDGFRIDVMDAPADPVRRRLVKTSTPLAPSPQNDAKRRFAAIIA
jgi:hypothetical protein